MAPWIPIHGRPRVGANVTWAATRNQLVARAQKNLPADLGSLLEKSGLAEESRAEILRCVGEEASLVVVESLTVNDLGAPTQRHYVLDEQQLAVLSRKPGEEGVYTVLTQEPNVKPLTFMVPGQASKKQSLPGHGTLVAGIACYQEFQGMRCHYGNLVDCYPSSGAARTLVVRFFDEIAQRPLLASVAFRTQALEVHLGIEALGKFAWPCGSQALAFWRRVQELLSGRSLLEQGLLPDQYAVNPLISAFQFLEIAETGRSGGWMDPSRPPGSWQKGIGNLRDMKTFFQVQPLLAKKELLERVDQVLQEAAEWCTGPGIRQVAAESIMGALTRVAARTIGVSLDSLVPLVNLKDDGAHLYLLDTHDGGSGCAIRIAECWKRMGIPAVERLLHQEHRCPAAQIDLAISQALTSGIRPDALAAMQEQDRLPIAWFEHLEEDLAGRAKRRLSRLIETPNLAAFSCYAMEQRSILETRLGGPPPDHWLLAHVCHTPALDARAEVLRQSFMLEAGGLSELPSRLAGVAPLCVNGCPECIGSDLWREAGYADRKMLEAIVLEGEES